MKKAIAALAAFLLAAVFVPSSASATERNEYEREPNTNIVVNLGNDSIYGNDGIPDGILVQTSENEYVLGNTQALADVATNNDLTEGGTWDEWKDHLGSGADVYSVPSSETKYQWPRVRAERFHPGPGKSTRGRVDFMVSGYPVDPGYEVRNSSYYRVVKVNPRNGNTRTVTHGRAAPLSEARYRVRFPRAKRPMEVKVISYGETVATFTVQPRN